VNVADLSVVPTRRVFRIGFRLDGYAGSLTATPPLLSTFRQQRAARARIPHATDKTRAIEGGCRVILAAPTPRSYYEMGIIGAS